ncbi:putative aarF domain-containing protein kinase 5 [Holothuria leucospilota]|uniref:AarF domain-containing protein kinase 5 n=1 Tax=Holothuria leucospilota TaxID=206669 RepID=A0A9Q1C8G0_HOLLE|nr:putative aarF domain-containing protein kinase 5 [Holothuria leucospilota]
MSLVTVAWRSYPCRNFLSCNQLSLRLKPSKIRNLPHNVRTFSSQLSSKPPKPKRKLFRKVFGGLLGLGAVAAGVSYATLDEIGKRKVRVSAEGLIRFFRTFYVGLKITLDYKWSLWRLEEQTDTYREAVRACNQRTADLILWGCLKNGGLYIKLGQGMLTANHVLPKEIMKTLSVLHDKALAREYKELDRLFLEDFGSTPDDLFAEFDTSPVAAASLAQVHKAKTHEGEDVAVKVQYINLRDQYHGDLWTVHFMLRIARIVHPKAFNFRNVLKEMEEPLARELDFENEGRNAERCARDLKHLNYIYIPKVLWDKTSKRILTMEYIDGCKITEKEKITEQGINLADVNKHLIEVFGEQIFQTGFVHADPHPGNIFVRKGSNGKAELVLLDHGLYEEIPPSVRVPLCHYWKSIILKDEEAMKDNALKMGIKEYLLFAMMLTQRPINMKARRGLHMTFNLDPKELRKMGEQMHHLRQRSEEFVERVNDLIHTFPRSLFLVSRNMNTVRSIDRHLGQKVDYLITMGRCAAGSTPDMTNASFRERLQARWERFLYDLILRSDRFFSRVNMIVFGLLWKVGWIQFGKSESESSKDNVSGFIDTLLPPKPN